MMIMINRMLLRKELRQLVPLLVAVLLLSLLSYVLTESLPSNWQTQGLTAGYILIALPALFAVGAGAMSVSQEKETRTLSWLASLPLKQRQLSWTKFAAAALGWLGLWIVTLFICYLIEAMGDRLFPRHPPEDNPIHSVWLVYWILQSFYLLVAGFLTAWRFRSSMTAMVAFVPLAVLPSLLRFATAYVQDPFHAFNSSRYDATLMQFLSVLCVLIVAALLLMNRFSKQSLAPEEAKLPKNPYASSKTATDTTIQSSQSVLGGCSALLWQFYYQNRTVYLSLFGTSLIIGLISLFMAGSNEYRNSGWETLAVFSILFATSWMGVLVFQSDNLHERIRYLAEHGVTPFKVWITRQLLPFGFVCCVSLFYLLILAAYPDSSRSSTGLPLWIVFWFLVFVYGYAQWFAQLVRNPVLSAIGGPILAAIAVGYTVYARSELSSLLVCIIVLSLAPFVATKLTMGRWMDRRFGWRYWCIHASILLIAVLLPLGDLVWYVKTAPDMPANEKVALRGEASQMKIASLSSSLGPNHALSSILSPYYENPDGEHTAEEKIELADRHEDVAGMIDALQMMTTEAGYQGMMITRNETVHLTNNLFIARVRLQRNPDDQSALKHYQDTIKFLSLVVREARRSVSLVSQEVADTLEIALIDELQLPATRGRLDGEVWDQIVALVSDTQSRNRARRRAVLAGWYQFDQSKPDRRLNDEFGEFGPKIYSYQSMTKWMLTHKGRVNHLASVLLEYLEQGPHLSDSEKMEFLKRRWPVDSNVAGNEIVQRTNWIDDPAKAYRSSFLYPNLPGNQWFAGWEQAGAELKNSK